MLRMRTVLYTATLSGSPSIECPPAGEPNDGDDDDDDDDDANVADADAVAAEGEEGDDDDDDGGEREPAQRSMRNADGAIAEVADATAVSTATVFDTERSGGDEAAAAA